MRAPGLGDSLPNRLAEGRPRWAPAPSLRPRGEGCRFPEERPRAPRARGRNVARPPCSPGQWSSRVEVGRSEICLSQQATLSAGTEKITFQPSALRRYRPSLELEHQAKQRTPSFLPRIHHPLSVLTSQPDLCILNTAKNRPTWATDPLLTPALGKSPVSLLQRLSKGRGRASSTHGEATPVKGVSVPWRSIRAWMSYFA